LLCTHYVSIYSTAESEKQEKEAFWGEQSRKSNWWEICQQTNFLKDRTQDAHDITRRKNVEKRLNNRIIFKQIEFLK
jgi:hypothetical protein